MKIIRGQEPLERIITRGIRDQYPGIRGLDALEKDFQNEKAARALLGNILELGDELLSKNPPTDDVLRRIDRVARASHSALMGSTGFEPDNLATHINIEVCLLLMREARVKPTSKSIKRMDKMWNHFRKEFRDCDLEDCLARSMLLSLAILKSRLFVARSREGRHEEALRSLGEALAFLSQSGFEEVPGIYDHAGARWELRFCAQEAMDSFNAIASNSGKFMDHQGMAEACDSICGHGLAFREQHVTLWDGTIVCSTRGWAEASRYCKDLTLLWQDRT